MTVRVFFQRFPRLFDVIKDELEEASKMFDCLSGGGQLAPSEAALYPILIILAKLSPSPISTGPDDIEVRPLLSLFFNIPCVLSQIEPRESHLK